MLGWKPFCVRCTAYPILYPSVSLMDEYLFAHERKETGGDTGERRFPVLRR